MLSLADRLRSGIAGALREVRSLGIERIVLATGDRREVADAIAESLPIDLIRTNLTPDQKTLVVLSERKNGPVMMIGDGINDAPALAAADLGLAMGAKGGAASAPVSSGRRKHSIPRSSFRPSHAPPSWRRVSVERKSSAQLSLGCNIGAW